MLKLEHFTVDNRVDLRYLTYLLQQPLVLNLGLIFKI